MLHCVPDKADGSPTESAGQPVLHLNCRKLTVKMNLERVEGKIWQVSLHRLGWSCAVIFAGCWSLFLIGITQPDTLYWDEVNYIPAVRWFLNGVIDNREHPPLAKELISLGLLIFGDTPLGWRFMVSLFGALALVAVYLWGLALFREQRPALWAVMFTVVNQMLYVESRTANIDTFMLTFMLGALAAYTASLHATTPAKCRTLLLIAGIGIGLSTACKWIGVVPWLICLGIVATVKQFQLWRVRFENPRELDWYNPRLWAGVRFIDWLVTLGAIPLALYYLSFFPTYGLVPLREFLQMHANVLKAMVLSHQDPVLLSHWTTWPIAKHPNYFTFTPWVTGASGNLTASVVVLLGNPLVLLLGLPAIGLCLHGWIVHRRLDAMLISIFYLGLYFCWSVIPRSATTFTYYFPAVMILGVALTYALTQTSLAHRSWISIGVFAICLFTFIIFLPITSAAVGTTPWQYSHLMWFNDWKWPRPGF
jgi:dolichyl-phosphate-mannose--protein O-mannosyl transferase